MNIHPYLKLIRFDKPIGTLLLFWPVAWALMLATDNNPPLKLIVIFTLGVFLTRSAGCVINDIIDRKLDKHVERTRSRPLAQGDVSLREAWVLFAVLMLLSASLLLFLNPLCFYLACIAAILTYLYPLTKRLTYFPQLVLGITFNMGVLMVYAAYLNDISIEGYLLYTAAIFWTLAYDTLYAMSDIKDDIKIGIKSTAIKFGKYSLVWVIGFYAVFYGLLWIAGIAWYALLIAIAFTGYILVQAYYKKDYLKAFKMNGWIGVVVFLGSLTL